MGDRVPIGTHPGTLAGGLLDEDLPVGAFAASVTATRVWFRRTDHQAGDAATIDLRTATGGGGDGITVTLADGVASAAATGAIVGTDFYARVTASGATGQNLSGWYEVDAPAGVTGGLLTTLARVKQALGITGSSNDAELTSLIGGVSARMQAYLRRAIVQQTITAEKHSGHGQTVLLVDVWPVIEPPSVVARVDGAVVTDFETDAPAGRLYRMADYSELAWDRGLRNVEVDYTAGFASVPADLAEAAAKQTTFEWSMKGTAVADRSSILDAGGSAQFLRGPWAAGVLAVLDAHRDRRF